MLIKIDGYEYIEPIILPEGGYKSGSFIFDLPNPDSFSPEYVKIYPNPAKDFIIVELLTGNANGASLQIFDNQSKLLKTVALDGEQQNIIVPIIDLKPGIFLLNVELGGKILESKKISKI